MGIERSYQAIPANSDLLDRARANIELGELLSSARFYFADGLHEQKGPTWPPSLELGRLIRALVVADPGLIVRGHYLEKSWGQVHRLLSATYRGEVAGPDDELIDVAMIGEAIIAEHVVGSQGVPVRYTRPAAVSAVAEALLRVKPDTLRRHYDLSAMEAQGVYKAFAGRESEEHWAYLRELVVGLQKFYQEAARFGDGVLVCTD